MPKLKLLSFKIGAILIFISIFCFRYIQIIKCTQLKTSKGNTEKDGDLNLRYQLLKYEDKMNNQASDYSAREVSLRDLKFYYYSQSEFLKRSTTNKLNSLSFPFTSYLEVKRQISKKDDPSVFLDYKYESNINKLPKQGEVDKKPWSSTYWPTKNGQISVRFNTNSKNSMGKYNSAFDNFTEMYNYNKSLTFYSQPDEYQRLIRTNLNVEKYIAENYSPSEKYDYLLGDLNFTLTNHLKQESFNFAKTYGDIPNWFGICHGWSVASYFYDKPTHQISLLAQDKKTKVVFVPEDIKALASLYWANVGYTTNFIGTRCNALEQTMENSDFSTGLYTSDQCFSINPGSLLLTLTNHVGIKKKNLVLDPMADPEIWNQPLNAYSVSYFNILNSNFFPEINKVKVDKNQIKNSDDTFLKFLYKKISEKTKALVGVMFNITYTQEIFPYHYSYAIEDSNKTETYIGVIELDDKDNILGGEWKYNAHPNFLWKYDEDHPVEGCCDKMAEAYDGQITSDLKYSAILASRKGQVIKSIVDYMVKLSHHEEENPSLNFLNNNRSLNETLPIFYEPSRSPIELPVATFHNYTSETSISSGHENNSMTHSTSNRNSNFLTTGPSTTIINTRPIISTHNSPSNFTNSNNIIPTTSTYDTRRYILSPNSNPTSNFNHFIENNFSRPFTTSNSVNYRDSDYEEEENEEDENREEDDYDYNHNHRSSRSNTGTNSYSNSRRSINYLFPSWTSTSSSNYNILNGMRNLGNSNTNSNLGSSRSSNISSRTLDWLLRGSGYSRNHDEDDY